MTTIQFVTQGEKAKGKTKASAFHWDGTAASMFRQGDHVLSWLECHEMVAEKMRKSGLQFNSVSKMQQLLPKYIWDLENANEKLDAENVSLRQQVESLTEQLEAATTEKKARK